MTQSCRMSGRWPPLICGVLALGLVAGDARGEVSAEPPVAALPEDAGAEAGGTATLADEAAAAALADAARNKAPVLEEQVLNGEPPGDAAVEPITEAEAQAVDPAGTADLDDPLVCLARTIYWEAKGEGEAGMAAVANVVINRLAHPAFPKTVCGVITEGDPAGPCQFSWWCDGRPIEVAEPDAYATAMEIARRALNQELPDGTDGALYFHGMSVSPDWAEVFTQTRSIGYHIFYRPDGDSAR